MAVTTTDDPVELYIAAMASFGEQVQAVQDHEWDLPTPCQPWTVRHVVAHVVLGDLQVPAIVAGDPVDAVPDADPSFLGGSPMSVWRGTALKAIEAARTPGMADADYDHPMGRLAGRQLLGFRISDNIVHAWDIGVAISRPIELDPTLAQWTLDFWLPVASSLADTDYYEAAITTTDGVTVGERLLGLLGREV